jgi:hypothetical protein
MSRIKNKAFRAAMKQAELERVDLWKDNGYFWIYSDTDQSLSLLPETAIYVNKFTDLTIPEWIESIKNLLKQV